MKSVFVINDNTVEARHAAESALMLAKKINARLLVGSRLVKRNNYELATFNADADDIAEDVTEGNILQHLDFLNDTTYGIASQIDEVDITGMDSNNLAAFINHNDITMVILSADCVNGLGDKKAVDFQVVLNKIGVPILLIPTGWEYKWVNRLTYITDLRYCRTDVLSYLSKITLPFATDLFVGHVAASGLPEVSTDFAKQVFYDVAKSCANYEHLNFHHIRSKDIAYVADVLINSMKNDALVLINHSQHYHYFIGKKMVLNYPQLISVPLLLYPH